ncbi:MAG: AMP-binding protein [Pseudomonadota bacterium]
MQHDLTHGHTAALLPPFTRLDGIPRHWAARTPGAPALREGARSWTYAQLRQGITHARAALAGLGIGAGHRVLLVGENCATLVFFVFAASELDATFILVNARQSADEIDAIAAHAVPQAEVYADAGQKDAALHGMRRGALPADCGAAGTVRIQATGLPAGDDAAEAVAAGVAAMVYTSGTTGKPKGVMLTHPGLLFIAQTMRAFRGLSTDDCSYAVLPLSHTMGLTSVLLSTLSAGGSVLVRPRFEVAALAEALAGGVTLFQGVQAMYSALLAYLKATGTALRAPRLRYIYAGGSPMDPTLKGEAEALFGLPLHNGYGMTESSPTLCHSPFGQHRDDAAVGPPIPGVEVRVVDADGQDVTAGASGELWARSPGVMRGYFRDPAATAEAIHGGWLRTGDLARRDADGCVHLVGRLKDIIIRSGFNVYPAEVEAAINTHPGVAQSAVVGRDVERNEEVVAFVQPRPGAGLDAAALAAYLKERVTAYKRPSRFVFLEALPTMANGKVQRTALKSLAAELEAAPL